MVGFHRAGYSSHAGRWLSRIFGRREVGGRLSDCLEFTRRSAPAGHAGKNPDCALDSQAKSSC